MAEAPARGVVPVNFNAVDHVGMTVSDMNRSVDWYKHFLERPPSLRKTWEVEYLSRIVGYPNCRMECAFWRLPGGIILELLHYLEPPPGHVEMEPRNVGNAHLCLITGYRNRISMIAIGGYYDSGSDQGSEVATLRPRTPS
jgi:catechol 2,3-dioxygenase-like lactoylglutathione lyase family enzyme